MRYINQQIIIIIIIHSEQCDTWMTRFKLCLYIPLKFVSSVVGDFQISSTMYRRHLIAAVELAVSCSELCFARPLCLETDWNIRVVK